MGNSRVLTRAQHGIEAPLVEVETHLGPGLPGFNVVGLPETAVRESRDRVRSAINNSGLLFPQQRITVNLAPADLPKSGGRYDLAIALGILSASQQVPAPGDKRVFIGELALNGRLRPVSGILPAALACQHHQQTLILSEGNGAEAALCRQASVHCAADLTTVCRFLRQQQTLANPPAPSPVSATAGPCLSEIRGQDMARRALEIAAAGGHSLLLCGPPGSGKSMLAARLPGLLPPLTDAQALEVASIHSLQTPRATTQFFTAPFRAPHHTASAAALTGGGRVPRPGELSLAHHGVLFLDELPEFDRRVLEALREPLETGQVHISRASQQACFPARALLVAAMNPCPCGYFGDPARSCGYDCDKARRYRGRLSGPLLDRIDLQLDVQPVSHEALLTNDTGESSARVRERVIRSRQRQLTRQGMLNSSLGREDFDLELRTHGALLSLAMRQLDLSARALIRLLRVARTIADLADSGEIMEAHVREALALRPTRAHKGTSAAPH